MKSTKKIIAIDKLRAFENHPYKVQDNGRNNAVFLNAFGKAFHFFVVLNFIWVVFKCV